MAGRLPRMIPSTAAELKSLETLNAVYDLYIWLAFRFEDAFPDRVKVEAMRLQCSSVIGWGLENMSHRLSKVRTQSRHHDAQSALQCTAVA